MSHSDRLNNLLTKTSHYDPDERYMAISDLCEDLKRHAASSASADSATGGATPPSSSSMSRQTSSTSHRLDSQTERKICSAVLKLLDDNSNDVQTVAVKTLSVLLTTVQEEQVVEIAKRLCELVLDRSKSDLRDVYAIGLKTLVETVPANMGCTVSQCLVRRLIDGITKSTGSTSSSSEDKTSEEIILACLNVLTDLLTRFGAQSASIGRQHDELLHATLGQLASPRPVVRKRAGTTIGVLATVIGDSLLHQLVERLLGQIDQANGLGRSGRNRARRAHSGSRSLSGPISSDDLRRADTRALIRTMCTVSGTVGHRLQQGHIDRIVPLFLRFCDPDDAVTGDDENGTDIDDDGDDVGDNDNLLLGNVGDGPTSEEATEAMKVELRESCFAGFESFVLRCPAQIQPHLDQIVHSALAYTRYDPNYAYGDEDNNSGGDDDDDDMDGDDDEDDDAYSEDAYSDDEDMSDEEDDDNWKVRRSAIRTLTAIVEATKHDPSKLWLVEYAWCAKNANRKATVAVALVERFKEREENCRVDIIECFTRLLAYTVAAASEGVLVLASSPSTSSPSSSTMEEDDSRIDLRSNVTSAIVKAAEKQLASKKKGGERSKSSAIALLSTLCLAPGGLGGSEQIPSVFGHIKSILDADNVDEARMKTQRHVSVNSKSLKLEALGLVRVMLSCRKHAAKETMMSLLPDLLPEICRSVREDWYKVISEALRVLVEVPRLLVEGGATDAQRATVAEALYDAIEPRLSEHDLDQEVKECALSAAATLLSMLHASLTDERKGRIFALLLARLKIDTTRMAAIKTLSVIGEAARAKKSGDGGEVLDLSSIMNESLGELALLLRQSSRGLKQSALECLDTMVLCLGDDDASSDKMDDGLFDAVLKDLGVIIVDTDLHICHLSLSASRSILRARASTGPMVKTHILPATLTLSRSPLLQDGAALASLLRLQEQIIVSDAVSFDEMHGLLAEMAEKAGPQAGGGGPGGSGGGAGGGGGNHKQVIMNLAECIATIAAATPPSKQESILTRTVAVVESPGSSSTSKIQLNLLVSGNLGRKVDMSSMPGVAESLQQTLTKSFDSSNEDVKHAAALALGRASVGAMDVFLPNILSSLEESRGMKKQYLLLSALRELIHCYRDSNGGGNGNGNLSANTPLILPHLERNCSNEEEGVRTMVAECLGSLACLEPGTLLPLLENLVLQDRSNDMLVCWTVGNAVKYAIGGKISPTELLPYMPTFLLLLQKDNLAVKNVALLMVYSAVHHAPQLVTGLMKEQILPSLYELAQLNLERKVDLGPFKHTVDDALPLRKASLSIISTCLEKCPSSLDIPAFMPVLAKAFADVEDIQLQSHQIALSMCTRHPIPLISAADSFVEALDKTVHKKKGQKTGTDLERVYEWLRSGLRVMLALDAMDGAPAKFKTFAQGIKKSAKHQTFLAQVRDER